MATGIVTRGERLLDMSVGIFEGPAHSFHSGRGVLGRDDDKGMRLALRCVRDGWFPNQTYL